MKGSILKFLGNGACLNPKFGNNSAYYYDKENKKLRCSAAELFYV